MDYLQLLIHSHAVENAFGSTSRKTTRLEYLSNHIFEFITYASDIDELFARKAVEVCNAITNRKTFDYIKTEEGHVWFLVMCNMPFFENKISWGTSIRGAWWDIDGNQNFEIDSCGLWEDEDQILEPIKFDEAAWGLFMHAVINFANPEMEPNVKLSGSPNTEL